MGFGRVCRFWDRGSVGKEEREGRERRMVGGKKYKGEGIRGKSGEVRVGLGVWYL